MARLLLRHLSVLRHLASVSATHDGSIKLNLVRSGVSADGWTWSASAGVTQGSGLEKRSYPQAKTKSITVHTSGRVNYHFSGGSRRYIPCLLDLEGPFSIVLYVVPSIDRLDEMPAASREDHIAEVDEWSGPMIFEFVVLPAVLPPLPTEYVRLGVEGLYALACTAARGNADVTRDGVPAEAFTTLQPKDGLSTQVIAEEQIYLRFKRAMYANDVHAAVSQVQGTEKVTAAQVEAMIAAGPGLFPPNQEGVWTIVTSVPMRIAPRLIVEFEDPRYTAEVIELRPGDTRLATVRVRFRVFDQKANAYVKTSVPILSIGLDAEL